MYYNRTGNLLYHSNINTDYKKTFSVKGERCKSLILFFYFLFEKLCEAIDEPEMNTDSTDFNRRKILNEGL